MHELSGLLAELDPAASETLRVISQFDRLIEGRVDSGGLLKGAAALCGAPVGYRMPEAAVGRRVRADGVALPSGIPYGWPTATAPDNSTVWLERTGPPQIADQMALERLLIALSISSRRLDTQAPTRRAVEILIDPQPDEEILDAAARLQLDSRAPFFAVAVPPDVELHGAEPHAVVATTHGVLQAVLMSDESRLFTRAGVGTRTSSASGIRASWRSALVALALTTTSRPIVHASSFGMLLHLLEPHLDDTGSHPEIDAVHRVLAGVWTLETLEALATGGSVRAIARLAHVHHSTIGERLRVLPAILGYDATRPLGRTRLHAALLIHRVRESRY